MKLSCWLSRFSPRRQVLHAVRMAEMFEPRVLMDATLPDLVVQTSDMTDSPSDEADPELVVTTSDDGELSETPEVIFYSLGGTFQSSPISQFGSRSEFGDYLLERALTRYDGLFGQPQWWYGGPIYFRGGNFLADAAVPASLDHSETNVQVNGVDEGDVIENDGQNLYLLNGNDLVIMQAYPAGEMRELSRIHFDGYLIRLS